MSSAPEYKQRVRALDVAIRDLFASASALGKDPDTGKLFRAGTRAVAQNVLDQVHRTLSQISHEHNRTVPILQLPPELLICVFDFLPMADALNACYVCRAWNEVIMHGAPSLWSTVYSTPRRQGALTAQLRRSGSADLRLNLVLKRHNWKETDQKLRHNGRAEFARALARPAPLLRTFRLLDAADNYNSECEDPLPLFANDAPALRFVKMHVDFKALARTVLPAVTSLLVANTSIMCMGDVGKVSASFPGVESLALEVDEWDDDYESEGLVRVPESVKDLVIISNASAVDPGLLLRHLDHTSIPHICVSYNRAVPADGASATFRELAGFSRVSCMRINTSALSLSENELNIDMWPSDDRSRPQRTILDFPIGARPSGAFFAHLTRLLVGELVLAVGDPFPPAAALRELTVQMLAPEYQAQDGCNSVFLLPRDRQRVLACPALRKLTFGARRHRCATRLAPHLALDFVRFHLDAPPLETLAIKGLELVTSIPEDAAEFVALARNFVVEDDYIIEPDRLDDLLAWT
ncbi:hypothetical protein AURDEDRAFT_150568 [Auricularia subglabra TFB-10046 SS5]|nr:hypothetical protein AURDEDRAFT_150568 [Auricularia subglabra TFB-10046 SS5]